MVALRVMAARPADLLRQRLARQLALRRGGGPVAVMSAGPAPGVPDLYRLRGGDPAAAEAFVAFFWPELEREAAHYARRGGEYDDLLGEGALALWEAAFAYDPHRHRTRPDEYVMRAVHQRVRRAYRRQMGFDRPPAGEIPAEHPAPDDPAARVEQRVDLAAALRRLAPAQQAELRHYLRAVAGEGLGPEAAARSVASAAGGGSPAAVKKRLQRTRRRVAAWLAPEKK